MGEMGASTHNSEMRNCKFYEDVHVENIWSQSNLTNLPAKNRVYIHLNRISSSFICSKNSMIFYSLICCKNDSNEHVQNTPPAISQWAILYPESILWRQMLNVLQKQEKIILIYQFSRLWVLMFPVLGMAGYYLT